MTREIGQFISKYQESYNPDIAVIEIGYIFQRTSYGMIKDQLYDVLFEQGVKKIPNRGAVHYYSTRSPWRDQADFFLAVSSGRGFNVLAVDYEHYYNNLNGDTARDYENFLYYLVEKRPNKRIIGYSGTYVYRDDLMPHVNLDVFDWWFARYPWFPKPQTGSPKMPIPMNRPWTFWQYDDEGYGSAYGCGSEDANRDVFNGTAEEANAYFKSNIVIPPTPPSCEKYINVLQGIKGLAESVL